MNKTVINLVMVIILTMSVFTATAAHEEATTAKFKVYGNCGMCKRTIEGALKDVKGVEKAEWDQKTGMMEVVYHEHDITLDDIKKRIAKVGYDTDDFRADDKTYKKLHGCCQYERPAKKKEGEKKK